MKISDLMNLIAFGENPNQQWNEQMKSHISAIANRSNPKKMKQDKESNKKKTHLEKRNTMRYIKSSSSVTSSGRPVEPSSLPMQDSAPNIDDSAISAPGKRGDRFGPEESPQLKTPR
jgi:hypothetical protein